MTDGRKTHLDGFIDEQLREPTNLRWAERGTLTEKLDVVDGDLMSGLP